MNIAILGLGTIGSGVYELCQGREDIKVKAILDRTAWMDIMTTDFDAIVNDHDIETVVEAMGGLHPAREYALACLKSGKNYVTANKHLVSEYGPQLRAAAQESGAALFFSAACGGGIPFLKNLADTALIDPIKAAGGILNGTTNFILDSMQAEKMDYAEALSRAQELGYAERDPSSDVDGLDTQRKIALASWVAFGKLPKAGDIPTCGIRNVLKADIEYLEKKGKRLRLIATARDGKEGVEAEVQPVVFSAASAESAIARNINYAWYEGEKSGHFAYSGQGAGKYPTAANMIRDVLAIMSGKKGLVKAAASWSKVERCAPHAYYARLSKAAANELGLATRRLETDADWAYIETLPMDLAEMIKMMSGVQGAFFAALD